MNMERLNVSGGIGRRIFTVLFLCSFAVSELQAASITLLLDDKSPQAVFASQDIQTALRAKGHSVKQSRLTQLGQVTDGVRIVLLLRSNTDITREMLSEVPTGMPFGRTPFGGASPPGTLRSEGYSIRTSSKAGRTTYWAVGADAAGVMYGGLELAEVIRLDGLDGIKDVDHNPYMAMRGTKFNIPLDVRTPSYTDVCDAAQNNIIEMWNFDFWKEYIDNLARYRYNYISLWNLHPFPSLVKVPDYPDVALDDVKRSKVQWKEYYPGNGTGFQSPEIMENLETLKKITIEEKIDFWRKVMRYGKDRNIDFYFITWNIFDYGIDGKYGITDNINNETTIDYFRKSVKQMFLTYPLLAGIGLTTGENMPKATFQQKEDWAFKTYAQGVLDAARARPGRKFTFIHRQHQTGAKDIARRFAPLIEHEDIEFIFSFKYAKAHVYSSTTQPYHPNFVKDIQEEGNLKTIWTLRNDDVYYFRWGAPDFVREFIQNIPYDVSRGFYLGSDQYVWGREFLSTEPETPRQIEIVKHWYHWMIWGRLGYDPNLSNERFIKIIQQRYPHTSGTNLFTAWQQASMVYPKTTGFHWGSLDFQWYIEACKSRPGPAKTSTGFHDVNRFISLPPHGGTDYVSIPDYVDALVAGQEVSGTTPIQVSNQIHGHADKALRILDGLVHGGNKELRLTLGDIRAMAYMGKYYAHKIRGATELALFRKTEKQRNRNTAIQELTKAAQYWRLYASTALCQYKNPLWTNRVGYCNWRDLMKEVLNDIKTAGGSVRLSSMPPTSGGTILEAETAISNGPQKAAGSSAYTGTGYLDFNSAADGSWVEWTFDAPQAGTYILEIRYTLEQGRYLSKMTVNGNRSPPKAGLIKAGVAGLLTGEGVGDIVLWTTGGKSTWAWDGKAVVLRKGTNTIRLTPGGTPLIDHLNVLYGGPISDF